MKVLVEEELGITNFTEGFLWFIVTGNSSRRMLGQGALTFRRTSEVGLS